MARSARRAGRRLRLLSTIGAAGIALGVWLPAAGAAEMPDVVPRVECSFLDPGTGRYNTVWGYKNETKGAKSDTAAAPGAACRANPVPIASASGWAPLATLAIATMVLGLVVFWRARRAGRSRRA